MTLVVASGEFPEGNVLSFNAFPTYPYLLNFVITFHVEGEVNGKIAYRARKREEVVYETKPAPFHVPAMERRKIFIHADRIELVFPSQGSYLLDVLFDESVLHS